MKIFNLLISVFIAAVALTSCSKDDAQIDDDIAAIKEYLSSNGINALESNKVYYEVLTEGTGEQCVSGDTIAVKYKVSTISNPDVVFDQTSDNKAVVFFLPEVPTTSSGAGVPIYGFQLGMLTMKEGGISRFYVPSSFAYGSNAIGEENEQYANLIFEVELCEIIHREKKH